MARSRYARRGHGVSPRAGDSRFAMVDGAHESLWFVSFRWYFVCFPNQRSVGGRRRRGPGRGRAGPGARRAAFASHGADDPPAIRGTTPGRSPVRRVRPRPDGPGATGWDRGGGGTPDARSTRPATRRCVRKTEIRVSYGMQPEYSRGVFAFEQTSAACYWGWRKTPFARPGASGQVVGPRTRSSPDPPRRDPPRRRPVPHDRQLKGDIWTTPGFSITSLRRTCAARAWCWWG